MSGLVLSGGGLKVVAFLGVLQELLRRRRFETILGVSAGAFLASLVAFGASPQRIFRNVLKTDWLSLLGGSISFEKVIQNRSIFDSRKKKRSLAAFFRGAGVGRETTFAQGETKMRMRLHVVSFCLESNTFQVFSSENTPDVSIFRAVLSSMAIPYVFPPVTIGNKRYVDPCIVNNCPISLLRCTETTVLTTTLSSHPDSHHSPFKVRTNYLCEAEIKACSNKLELYELPSALGEVTVLFATEGSLLKLFKLGLRLAVLRRYEKVVLAAIFLAIRSRRIKV